MVRWLPGLESNDGQATVTVDESIHDHGRSPPLLEKLEERSRWWKHHLTTTLSS